MFSDMPAIATLAVKSLERARPFYEQVLGLTRSGDADMGVQGYRTGGATLMLYESAFAGTNRANAVTWALGGDFDRAVAELQSKGVAFERYDLPDAVMDGDVHVFGQMRVAWFKDPDGNIINIGNYPTV